VWAERRIVLMHAVLKATIEKNSVLPTYREGAFLKVSKGERCHEADGNASQSRSVGQNKDHVIWIRNNSLTSLVSNGSVLIVIG
jgi:hypothetical protein